MGSIDYVRLLRGRSYLFYEYAREAYSRGHFDLAMFYVEQALQLRLKSLALRLLGQVPRLHCIRELFSLIVKFLHALGRGDLAEMLCRLVEDNREVLKMRGEAYTAARYLPRTYGEEDCKTALEVADKAIKLIDNVENSIFS